MNDLPDTKTLLELLQIAKEAEQKAKELFEKGEKFAQKWESRLGLKFKNDKEKEREDRQQEKMLTLLGSLMGNAMQNPDVFKTLMEMGQQQNINNPLKEET